MIIISFKYTSNQASCRIHRDGHIPTDSLGLGVKQRRGVYGKLRHHEFEDDAMNQNGSVSRQDDLFTCTITLLNWLQSLRMEVSLPTGAYTQRDAGTSRGASIGLRRRFVTLGRANPTPALTSSAFGMPRCRALFSQKGE